MIKFKPKIIVTAALPYANGPIHIGHLVEYIQTDIFVRFLKLIGEDVVYCCADDTHGTPIQIKAEQLGITPEQLIAKFHKEHQEDFAKFHIKFDSYYTTNSPENRQFSESVFLNLKEKGHIYQKEIELSYCEHCKRFLPDRYVKGKCPKCKAPDQYGDVCEKCNAAYHTTDLVEPYCIICKNKPVRKKSIHYFFKLSEFSDKLRKFLKEKPLQPEIVNFVNEWIEKGLEDWCISRDGPYFGFKIPGEKDKYFYVWLDAPFGYIASLANNQGNDAEKAKQLWNDPKNKIIHFIGKDIVYFHFLFWPAVLIGAGFKAPDDIVVHGFLTVNREKMSKSRGTFLTASEFASAIPTEYLRFHYAANLAHVITDIDLDLEDFSKRINNELVANIGNFCYRVLSFLEKNFNSEIKEFDERDLATEIVEIEKRAGHIKEHYREYNFREAVKEIQEISSIGNKFFQKNAPWELIKTDREKTLEILSFCVNIAKNLSIVIKPILPEFSKGIEKQLNLKELSWKDINFDLKNHKLGKSEILIRKLEEQNLQIFKKHEIRSEEAKDKFSAVDLRVAEILEVNDHPSADKLYVIKIDNGKIKKQIVAGIKKKYNKEELVGKKIVVVDNLEPAELRGQKSEAMLLVGMDDKDMELLNPGKAKAGDSVSAESIKPELSGEISFNQFSKFKLIVKNGKAFYKDKALKTKSGDIFCENVNEGKVQ